MGMNSIFALGVGWMLIGVFTVSNSKAEEGHCVWYDQCGTDEVTGKPLNCLYNGPPQTLNDTLAQQTFKALCPQLAGTGKTPPKTCCSASQIETLDMSMALPKQILTRCPSCYRNFLNLYCYFTCAPDHSKFLNVNKTKKTDNGTTSITAINYVVSKDFANGMFNSCRDVQMPSDNQKALSVLCGQDASSCTPQKWLDFMGNTNNQQTPFTILFNLTNSDVKFGNRTLTPMNERTSPCKGACSCQDCRASCGVPLPPVKPTPPCTILNIDCGIFVGCSLYIAFVLIFGTYLIFYCLACAPNEPQSILYNSESSTRQSSSVNSDSNQSKAKVRVVKKPSCLERLGASLEKKLLIGFSSWGRFCASRPITVIVCAIVLCGIFMAGIARFKVMTDPVELWSAPNSRARQEKDYFDNNFTPFYRTEMLIITAKNDTKWPHENSGTSEGQTLYGALLRKDILSEVLALQTAIENLTVFYPPLNRTIGLEDICFAPMSPDNKNCTIQSVLNYFQNSQENLDKNVAPLFFVQADYIDHFTYCVSAPASVMDTTGLNMSCMGTFGGPVMPWVALGGYQGDDYGNATALVVTFTVNNFKDKAFTEMALAWEAAYLDLIKNFSSGNITVAFSAERSIEDEINRESNSDVRTILISYFVMFVYVAIMLGQYHSVGTILVHSKILLGLAGVLIVAVSVVATIGFYSYLGVPSTLIIIEVVPFLVLAVGVDNIFILVQAYQREDRKQNIAIPVLIGKVLGKVGPSMLLTSLSESIAFFLGAMTQMPAVRVFSLYAAMAVLIDFLLQISCFVALLALDARREVANRPEGCCCVKASSHPDERDDILFYVFKKFYSPFLLSKPVRIIVMFVTFASACCCVAVIDKVKIGLDQRLAMPLDSYMLDYFGNMSRYLSVGSPLYFVVEDGHNYTTTLGQNKICGSSGCPEMSLLGQVYKASQQPNSTKVAHPASSWLDDYFDWIAPGGNPPCCRQFQNNASFCKSTVKDKKHKLCEACKVQVEAGRPVREDFLHFLPWFLTDNPGLKCAKGGHAAYGSAVQLKKNKTGVGATYFMTFHTVLNGSADFIMALKQARQIADNVTLTLNHWPNQNSSIHQQNISKAHGIEKVFPYSVFYVFYEQYLTIVHDTVVHLSTCVTAIFIVSFLLLGFDVWTALIITFTICLIIIHMFGLMYLWNIDLNALSLVNLVVTVGISVEFCSHIARAFAVSTKATRVARAEDALAHMGSSVLSGISLTKLGGITVLAFSKSQLFFIFYFKMYLGIVVFGATHGLIFLPILLSYVGPPVNKARLKEDEGFSELEDESDQRPIVNSTDPPAYTEVAAERVVY